MYRINNMKIETSSELIGPAQETLTIKITWNPRVDDHEGYAAMINSIVDTVKRNILLTEALEASEEQIAQLEVDLANAKSTKG